MSVHALNLFDLADDDDYLAYSHRSIDALGKLDEDAPVLERLEGLRPLLER
jgi:hypothetical protein